MLEQLTISNLFSLFLLFCRVGSMFMAMPGIGEAYVAIRIRLLLSIAVAVLLFFPLQESLPPLPGKVVVIAEYIFIEIIIGIFLGSLARILLSAMHVTGMIIATVSGLSAATLFDPNQGAQGAIVGNFLTVLVMTILFATHIDQLLLQAVSDSYSLFPAGKWPLIGDMTATISKIAGESFNIAVKITLPQLVIGLVLFAGAGVLARLMPAMQVFFVLMPVQIVVSFAVLMITLSAGIFWYLDYIHETLQGFLAP